MGAVELCVFASAGDRGGGEFDPGYDGEVRCEADSEEAGAAICVGEVGSGSLIAGCGYLFLKHC